MKKNENTDLQKLKNQEKISSNNLSATTLTISLNIGELLYVESFL
jgi:hypothetical protein